MWHSPAFVVLISISVFKINLHYLSIKPADQVLLSFQTILGSTFRPYVLMASLPSHQLGFIFFFFTSNLCHAWTFLKLSCVLSFVTEGFECRMRTCSFVYCPHQFLNNFSLSTHSTYSTNSTAVGFLKLRCTRSEGCTSTIQGLIKHNAFNDYKQAVLWPFILACVREKCVPTLPGCWRGSLGRPPYECVAESSDYIHTNLKCMTDY